MVSWHYWWNVYKMAIDWCAFGMLYTKWYPLMQWQMYMYLSYAMYSAWYTQPIRSTRYPGEWYYFIIYQCILCLKTISPKTVFYEEKTNFIAPLEYAMLYLLHSKHSCVSSKCLYRPPHQSIIVFNTLGNIRHAADDIFKCPPLKETFDNYNFRCYLLPPIWMTNHHA